MANKRGKQCFKYLLASNMTTCQTSQFNSVCAITIPIYSVIRCKDKHFS